MKIIISRAAVSSIDALSVKMNVELSLVDDKSVKETLDRAVDCSIQKQFKNVSLRVDNAEYTLEIDDAVVDVLAPMYIKLASLIATATPILMAIYRTSTSGQERLQRWMKQRR